MFKDFLKIGAGFYVGYTLAKSVDKIFGISKKLENLNVSLCINKIKNTID